MYTAKNAQVVSSLLTSYNNLLQQADIRMRSHGLRQLVTTSLLQVVKNFLEVNCQNVSLTGYSCKLFQQVVTSLQITNCNKPDFNKLVAT